MEFSASGLKERLSPEMETAIYRIVQESLTNTAKHAQAQHVWVTARGNQQLTLYSYSR